MRGLKVASLGRDLKIAATILCALAALTVAAQHGHHTKSATGTASATAYFPGGDQPLKLVALDVTSDNATGACYWAAGTVGTPLLKAALSTATNVVVGVSSLASNDVCLLQNSTSGVVQLTVWGRTQSTNKVVQFGNVLGTNLAIGDTFARRLTTAYTLRNDAASDATTLFVDLTTGLVANEAIVAKSGTSLAVATVSAVATNAWTNAVTREALARPLAPGDPAWRLTSTNTYVAMSTNLTAGQLSVGSVTGFTVDDAIVIETPGGELVTNQVLAVATGWLTVTQATGIAIPIYSAVTELAPTAYTVGVPAAAGAKSFVYTAAGTLASGDVVVFVPAAQPLFRATLAGTPAASNIVTITLSGALGVAFPAQTALYELTNTFTTTFTAARTDFSAIVSSTTGLADGDAVIISPASGGVFENFVWGTPASLVLNTVNFTAALGQPMAVGDAVWLLGTAQSTVVGAATLRLSGDPLRYADQGCPVKLQVTGASACSINSVTVFYGP